MIIVEYQPNVIETTKATLDFLDRRPIVKIIILLMKSCCFIMSVAYLLKAVTSTLNIHDMLILLFALIWLFGHRTLNYIILKRALTKQKINLTTNKFHLSKHKLWWLNIHNHQPMQQAWNQIKYIYRNQDGYIIPSIGTANAGKFIWLPKRGFNEPAAEQKFLKLLEQLNIKIK